MQFNVEKKSTKGIEIISIEHNGVVLNIDASGYQNIHVNNTDTIFYELNIFLKSLPKQDADDIFEIYKQVKSLCNIDAEPHSLNNALNDLVIELYDILEYSRLRRFVLVDMHLPIASNIRTHMDPNKSYDRSITYLKDDYEELLILILGLRFLLPIWGAYLPLAKRTADNFHKERFSLLMLDKSSIVEWEAYTTLQKYISSHKTIATATYGLLKYGLTINEIPEYFLAAIVKKLLITKLTFQNDEDDLATIIYNTVRCFDEQLKVKSVVDIKDLNRTVSDKDDDNSSVWDRVRAREKIATGDRVIINTYVSNPYLILDRLDPDIDLKKLEICLEYSEAMVAEPTRQHHGALCIWVMGKVMSPNAVKSLYPYQFIKIMAIVQAYLWHHGFEYLALLLTSSPLDRELGGGFGGIDGRVKLAKGYVEELESIYKYTKLKDRNSKKKECVAIEAIDLVTDSLLRYNWRYKGPDELLDKFPEVKTTYQLSPTYAVKSDLAELIIKLASRK